MQALTSAIGRQAAASRWRSQFRSTRSLSGQLWPWRRTIGHSHYDPAAQCRPAWNAGKTVGAKRPLTQKQIWAVRFFLDREGRVRDRALFDLAIDSKLRGCDLVKIKIGDLVSGADIGTRAIVIQQKTGKPVQFELTADVRASLLAWFEHRGGTVHDYAFQSRVDHAGHRSTANTLDLSMNGLRQSDFAVPNMARTRSGARRHR